jgi:type II secretory pathway component PulF
MNEVFPETARQMTGVGEGMGGLDLALGRIADLYELEVSRGAISRLPFVTVSLTIILLVLIALGLKLIQSL